MPSRLHNHSRTLHHVSAALLILTALVLLLLSPTSQQAAASGARQFGSVRLPIAAYNSLTQLRAGAPTWSTNVRANTDTTTNGQHEPGLAVSPANPNVVVIANKDYRDSNIKRVWIEASRDGGLTWPTQLHMPNLPTTENESDPVVMARDDGRIYVSCLTTGNNGIFITWTDDGGLTWQPSVAIVQNQGGLQDKDWFAVDNNPSSPFYHRMYMAWAPGGVVSSYSTNGGQTWTAPQQIPNPGGAPIEYPYPVVAPNGDVFLFHMYDWGARWPSPSTVKVVKSTNGGVSWGQPVSVATSYQPQSPPRSGDTWRFYSIISAATDPANNNRLYAAWTDDRNHNTNGMDVMYSASTDHGTTWGPPTRMSHDPTGVVRDHITPMVSVSADGRLHAMWLDRRLDSANRLFQAWYSASTDGGATWQPDSQVSDAPGLGFDLNIGLPPGSGNAAGDYWGLDTAGGNVYTAWTDTRNGNQDIYTSRATWAVGSPTPTVTGTPPTATNTPTVPDTSTPSSTSTRTNTQVSTPTRTSTTTGNTATSTPTFIGTPPTATITPTPCSITFSDVHPPDYFYSAVTYLFCRGVISGYIDNTFRPYNLTTRGQLTKIVVLAEGITLYCPPTPTFVDVPVSDAFYCYIETAYHANLVSGYTCGTGCLEFRPGVGVTRGQLCKIIVLAEQWTLYTPPTPTFQDVPDTDPFYQYIETAYSHNIISGYTCGAACLEFRPSASATRGQICKIVYNAVTAP